MSDLKFVNINKIYDNNVQAVFDFNLEIKDKEFIVFVGPSGCGKSTTLRMVSGLEEISSGELYIDGKLVNNVEPKDRDIAMVFQNYALYPHMTVFKNLAFSLTLRKFEYDVPLFYKKDEGNHKKGDPVLDENGKQVFTKKKMKMPKEEIRKKVYDASEILGLTPYLDRKPKALSGGQRQRVALGRTIVREPKVFLMDEPLSNLDAKLRVQMRSEIAKIHRRVNATTIYVTHDQTEAMTMASRIVIMKDGYIQQIGTPRDVYNNPSNVFVATFIGSPSMNIFDVEYDNGKVSLPNDIKITLPKQFIIQHDEFYKNEVIRINEDIKNKQNEILELKKFIEENDNKFKKLTSNEQKENYFLLDKDIKELTQEINSLNSRLEDLKDINKPHHILLGVRPEDIYMKGNVNNKNPSEEFSFTCDVCELLGHELLVYGELNGQKVLVKVNASYKIEFGKTYTFSFDLSHIHLFDKYSEKKILKDREE